MVRTKTEARKSTGGKLRKDMSWTNIGPIVYHNNFFNDHTGKQVLMSCDCCKADGPIPPLASWVYYTVHPDVLQEFDGCALHGSLASRSIERGGPFRYEFFFLPEATAEECHAHYSGEMKARGTIWRQIRKVNRAVKLKKQESGKEEEQNSETESYNRCYNK
ncbi:hypothetical protein FVEN_g9120 [Fusarium venenatum]|nr:hypothetical protein FVEN_g9120 [Fusarium venenatum]